MIAKPTEKKSVYKSFSLHNYRQIPQISRLTEEQIKDIDVVVRVFTKTNIDKTKTFSSSCEPTT